MMHAHPLGLIDDSRAARRERLARETKARRTGRWGGWKHHRFPAGSVGHGWSAQIEEAFANDLYAVLVRQAPGGVVHLAIRTLSHL